MCCKELNIPEQLIWDGMTASATVLRKPPHSLVAVPLLQNQAEQLVQGWRPS